MNIKNIIALKEVSNDLKLGEEFYEKQSLGDSIISDIESLWLYVGIHQKVFGLYRLLSKRFPYGIYYKVKDDVVIIVAVLDLRQNPINISSYILNRKQ